MERFEYKIIRIPRKSVWHNKIDYEALEKELNDLGSQGWEVSQATNSMMYENKFTALFIILKRKK